MFPNSEGLGSSLYQELYLKLSALLLTANVFSQLKMALSFKQEMHLNPFMLMLLLRPESYWYPGFGGAFLRSLSVFLLSF